jgi:hypothetical protein
LLITMYQVRDWSYEIQSRLPSTYTKRWLRWKLQSNRTIVRITFKVVIAYLSRQEMDQLASWGRILLQISRSSHKTWMICITQKTSAAKDYQEDSANDGIIEETNHPASSIDMAEQQASSLFSANKIDGRMFDDVKETNIAIKKSILTISDRPSGCVVEWVDADLVPFVCSALNPVVQNNW